eukprot:5771256-Prymnesium_polylepis.1
MGRACTCTDACLCVRAGVDGSPVSGVLERDLFLAVGLAVKQWPRLGAIGVPLGAMALLNRA